jgi:hypothetical protein
MEWHVDRSIFQGKTNLYTLPPDAAGEIERLHREADDQRLAADQMRKAWRDRGEKMERLNRAAIREDEFGPVNLNDIAPDPLPPKTATDDELLIEQVLADARVEVDRLKATVSNLERVAMLIHNFPSHPGGHKADRSDEAMVPEDWRHGWICAVAAMQESVMEAQQADHTQSDTVSDQVRSDTIQNDIETLQCRRKENKP